MERNMREIYLDNSATTQAYPQVAEVMSRVLTEDYGNPSSLHTKGMAAEQYIRDAYEIIGKALKAKDKEILFTSCGTEGDNLAIIGGAHAAKRRGKHLITTKIEHPAVLEAMAYLEREGYEVTYLPVNATGSITVEQVRDAIREDTILVSLMQVNNEIGSVLPVEEVGKMLKKEYPDILFHVDAVQGFGKYRIYPERCGIDFYAFSGHKIHGPKGMGVLYIRDGVKVMPLLYGGGQQRNLRPGTENVPGIAGMAKAVELTLSGFSEKKERLYALKSYFMEELSHMDGVMLHGPVARDGAPHIVSAGFSGIRAEVILHALEEKGIYVSSGSACASNHPGTSGTLQAVKTPEEYLHSTIRFSMSEFTTKEEIDATLAALKELVPVLRRFTRR